MARFSAEEGALQRSGLPDWCNSPFFVKKFDTCQKVRHVELSAE